MKKEEVEHLAKLARIELAPNEADALTTDITSILGYVGEIKSITADAAAEKKVGSVHTVLREDGEPHEGGIYTDDLLAAAPKRNGRYIEVKKILGNTP